MNKKIIYGIVIAAIIVVGAGLILFKFPLNFNNNQANAPQDETSANGDQEYKNKFNEIVNAKKNNQETSPANVSNNVSNNDQVAAPQEETPANDELPEEQNKINTTIKSKDDFVNFIKKNKINELSKLDNFKDAPDKEVNWNKVLDSVKVEEIDNKTTYSIEYTPNDCSASQKFTLKMTNDGHVSIGGYCENE